MLIRQNTDLVRLERVLVDFILNAISFDYDAKPERVHQEAS
jgi:hypothetical protein